MAEKPKTVYLGDGVYAEFEDGMIQIWTQRGPDMIYLEPEVFLALVKFAKKVWEIPSK